MAVAISAKRPPNGRLFSKRARKGNGVDNPALPLWRKTKAQRS